MTRWNPEVVRFSLGKADVEKTDVRKTEVAKDVVDKVNVENPEAVNTEDARLKSTADAESAIADIPVAEDAGITPAPATTPDDAAVTVESAAALQPQGIAIYEHPLVIRITHWVNAVSLTVMILSGIQIFAAFPSFSDKVPSIISLPIRRSSRRPALADGFADWLLVDGLRVRGIGIFSSYGLL